MFGGSVRQSRAVGPQNREHQRRHRVRPQKHGARHQGRSIHRPLHRRKRLPGVEVTASDQSTKLALLLIFSAHSQTVKACPLMSILQACVASLFAALTHKQCKHDLPLSDTQACQQPSCLVLHQEPAGSVSYRIDLPPEEHCFDDRNKVIYRIVFYRHCLLMKIKSSCVICSVLLFRSTGAASHASRALGTFQNGNGAGMSPRSCLPVAPKPNGASPNTMRRRMRRKKRRSWWKLTPSSRRKSMVCFVIMAQLSWLLVRKLVLHFCVFFFFLKVFLTVDVESGACSSLRVMRAARPHAQHLNIFITKMCTIFLFNGRSVHNVRCFSNKSVEQYQVPVQKSESEKQRSWSMPVAGFQNHAATESFGQVECLWLVSCAA